MEKATMPPGFEHIAFMEPESAMKSLRVLLDYQVAGLEAALADSIGRASSPDKELMGLVRYFQACADPAVEATRIAAEPEYLRMLGIAFSQSRLLTDILCLHPEHAAWVWAEAPLERARPVNEMLSDLLGPAGTTLPFEQCCEVMRSMRKREILRIAVREMDRHAPLESVTEDLSNLADAALEAAIRAAAAELRVRFGVPAGHRAGEGQGEATFTVLAMGKLGGRELNFSSDIDLLFLYSDEGKTETPPDAPRARAISNAEYFTKLGERVIKALSEPMRDGMIFRVDMRLRPHGRDGALATSVDAAIDYYVHYGRAWERQALIKARACAGDLALGNQLIARMRPFVFPKYFDDETLEDIRSTKRQLEESIAARGKSEREVKLGRGGIRDIEFTVQMLQLLNGGRWPDLRTPSTLEAIAALGRHNALSPLEAESLRAHYVFLRQVEHRLQVENGHQIHALPEDAAAMDEFARRLGYPDGAAFLRIYGERTNEIRGILEHFLAVKGSGNLWVGDLLNPHSEGEAGKAKLAEIGFKDPETARRELLFLAKGPKERPHSLHVSQQFAEIAPFMLQALSYMGRPDAVLLRLSQILNRINAPGTVYELLRCNPALCHFLVTLVSNSEYLCNLLIRDPGLLDAVSTVEALDEDSTLQGLKETLAGLECAYDCEAALYRLRDGEMLHVAMRELIRHSTVARVGDELTLLAEVILGRALEHALERQAQRFGKAEIPCAVLGLGKLGGWEMGYGSDLDLVFVYEGGQKRAAGLAPSEYFAGVAAQCYNSLKQPTRYGILYDIDARLRPDGNKGPLAVSLARLVQYFQEEAQPWERLALMKVRAVAGDNAFGQAAERAMKTAAFSLPLDRPSLEQIESLRRKHFAQATRFEIKKQAGGINDAEFIVRFWQLRHAAAHPGLMRGDVFGALDIIEQHELAALDECAVVRKAYGKLRRVLNRVRMADGGQGTELPRAPEERSDLAGRLGIKEELLDYVNGLQEEVRVIYERTYTAAYEAAGK